MLNNLPGSHTQDLAVLDGGLDGWVLAIWDRGSLGGLSDLWWEIEMK